MSVCFLLIPIAKTEAKKLIIPLSNPDPDSYVSFNDLNQMKILILTFVVTALVKIVWDVLKSKNSDVTGRIVSIEKTQHDILNAIQRLGIHLDQVKASQVVENEVREIVRNEIDYAEKVERKRRQ